MCIICIDFDRGAMTSGEARRALGEMTAKIGPEHAQEVKDKLDEAEAHGPPSAPPSRQS